MVTTGAMLPVRSTKVLHCSHQGCFQYCQHLIFHFAFPVCPPATSACMCMQGPGREFHGLWKINRFFDESPKPPCRHLQGAGWVFGGARSGTKNTAGTMWAGRLGLGRGRFWPRSFLPLFFGLVITWGAMPEGIMPSGIEV